MNTAKKRALFCKKSIAKKCSFLRENAGTEAEFCGRKFGMVNIFLQYQQRVDSQEIQEKYIWFTNYSLIT